MNKKNMTPVLGYVSRFSAKFKIGLGAIEEAAKIYAEAVRLYGDMAQAAFNDAYPAVSEATWDKLRLIGNNDAHPAIMLCTDRIGLRIARLPFEDQKRLLGEGGSVKVVNKTTGETEEIAVSEIKPRHEAVLFDGDRARSVAEQRKYIREKANEAAPAITTAYRIEGSILVITRACRLGVSELKSIIKKLEEGAK